MDGIAQQASLGKRVIQWFRSFFTIQSSALTYLNVTQFLGALNDNIYKLLIVYFFIELEGIENSHRILATAGATFVIPFLLFSSASGTLADRLSKSNIIIATKILEFVIMAAGVFAFLFQSKLGSYTILFMMATQSALFGPSKYGILPEIVTEDRISKANGLLSSFTFLAIIIGTFLASFVLDVTGRNFIAAGLFCTVVALVGLITSYCIGYTEPAGSVKKCNPWFVMELYDTLKLASKQPSLLAALSASAFFLFIAAFFQLNLIPFAVQSLGLTDVQGGYLFLLTALGIGAGSLLAGRISGDWVELGLVPLGGIGLIVGCFLLDWQAHHLPVVLASVFLLGVCSGFYIVPLDSYIQVASPNQHRGQVVATTNFFAFFGVLIASGLIYANTELFGLQAHQGFAVIGSLSALFLILIGYQFFDYVSRFIAMCLSRVRFRTMFFGRENIPADHPAVYICSHVAWNDALLMLGAQRRRMRFFIEKEQEHTPLIRRLYRMLRIVRISTIEPWADNTAFLNVLRKTLKKGLSVCVFVENADLKTEIPKLRATFASVLLETQTPIIPVTIDKGEKLKQPRFFTRLLNQLHCPALVTFKEPIPAPQVPTEQPQHELSTV